MPGWITTRHQVQLSNGNLLQNVACVRGDGWLGYHRPAPHSSHNKPGQSGDHPADKLISTSSWGRPTYKGRRQTVRHINDPITALRNPANGTPVITTLTWNITCVEFRSGFRL